MKSRKSVARAAAAALLALSAATAQGQVGGEQVGNFVWNDLNQNGLQDGGSEVGLAGVTVELYNFSGLFASTATGATGEYLFSGLETSGSSLQLRFLLPVGFSFSPVDQGGNDALDSDANPATGYTASFWFNFAQTEQLTWDAGMYRSQVPEPGSLALLGLGAGAIGLARRRKRRS